MMERFLAEGKTDLFAMARQFLADDHYYEKVTAGLPAAEIVPCILCNGCHGHHTCSVNPRLGRKRNLFAETTTPKKAAVIGGGPGGMMAALTAARRGHQVTLYEKAPMLGGQLVAASMPDYKWPIGEYLAYLLRELYKLPVQLQLGITATPELLKEQGYDAILCAPGSEPVYPPVPGRRKRPAGGIRIRS